MSPVIKFASVRSISVISDQTGTGRYVRVTGEQNAISQNDSAALQYCYQIIKLGKKEACLSLTDASRWGTAVTHIMLSSAENPELSTVLSLTGRERVRTQLDMLPACNSAGSSV